MKKTITFLAALAALLAATVLVNAQSPAGLVRTVYKTDRLDFGVGGTISIAGAPNGSIRIEGWNKNEVEISAEIELRASTPADLDQLEKVTGFVMDESPLRLSIYSVGVNDRKHVRNVAKKFPKHLYDQPFRINYVLKVPAFTDLTIDGGKGDLYIGGVEGTFKINFLEPQNATLDLVGGGTAATFGTGTVNINIPTRSWRGRFLDIQLASGTMNLSLPPGLNGNFDASILRTGKIENTFTELKPRIRKAEFTDKLIAAKAGNGGISLKFSVGDGTMNIFGQRK